jgi:hypothetical protein
VRFDVQRPTQGLLLRWRTMSNIVTLQNIGYDYGELHLAGLSVTRESARNDEFGKATSMKIKAILVYGALIALSCPLQASSDCDAVGLGKEVDSETAKLYYWNNDDWEKVTSSTILKRQSSAKFAYVIRDKSRNGVLVIKSGVRGGAGGGTGSKRIALIRQGAMSRFACINNEDSKKIARRFTGSVSAGVYDTFHQIGTATDATDPELKALLNFHVKYQSARRNKCISTMDSDIVEHVSNLSQYSFDRNEVANGSGSFLSSLKLAWAKKLRAAETSSKGYQLQRTETRFYSLDESGDACVVFRVPTYGSNTIIRVNDLEARQSSSRLKELHNE